MNKSKYDSLKQLVKAPYRISGVKKGSKVHDFLVKLLENGHAYTGFYRGYGWRTTAVDYTSEVCIQLDKLGISYKTGNDAPRGGVHGNYVEITMTAFIKEVKKARALREKEEKAIRKARKERLEIENNDVVISSKSEEESVLLIGCTHEELVSIAKQTIEWVTDEYKDDIHGRYWLNVYHGAEVYELIIQKGRIVGSICEGFYPTIPQINNYNIITREQWIGVLTEVIRERIGDNWHFVKADGSGCAFYLREDTNDEELRHYVKEYKVPDMQHGGMHTNYEITATKQKRCDHIETEAEVEFDWSGI